MNVSSGGQILEMPEQICCCPGGSKKVVVKLRSQCKNTVVADAKPGEDNKNKKTVITTDQTHKWYTMHSHSWTSHANVVVLR